MALQFHNTYSGTREAFQPIDPEGRAVKMYTCGPTVYTYAHIGNFRAYTFEDLLQRHLELRGYAVQRVMNLTDVDDKTIRGCRQAGQPLDEFTRTFKDAFFSDLATLRIKPADAYPAATEAANIQRMIEMIGQLIDKGHAYRADDGSVYYRIQSFQNYGRLAKLNLDELKPGARVSSDEYEKESLADFALWKAWDEQDGDVWWESPWGRGRPGWHIECSAMATRLLGPELDIHCGGEDNVFPHHEAEIAQSEPCTGHQFVRYWLHCAHLLVDGRKMSKSLGNFHTLRDLLEKGYTGREVRYVLLSAHYRTPLNFTIDGLNGARSALLRLDEWLTRLDRAAAGAAQAVPHDVVSGSSFEEALDDDLNISAALGHLFDVLRNSNRLMDAGELSPEQARGVLEWWQRVNRVLALEPEQAAIPQEVQDLLQQRAQARAEKNWSMSDQLRDQIHALGWQVKDTKQGQELTRLS